MEDSLSIPILILIPLPSTVSNFLNRYRTYSLEESLDNTREEFKDNKRAIIDLETRIRNAGTVSEIQEIKEEISQSITDTVQKGNASQIILSVSKPISEAFITGMIGGDSQYCY
jgi:hypothetical protein